MRFTFCVYMCYTDNAALRFSGSAPRVLYLETAMRMMKIGGVLGLVLLYGSATRVQAGNAAMQVMITGPSQVRVGATCSWVAYTSGGTAPYTYDWYGIDGWTSPDGSMITTTAGLDDLGNNLFEVSVSDAGTNTISAYKTVMVTNTAPDC